MVSSGSVFSETLQTITTTKLEELAKQRIAFEKEYAALLQATQAESNVLQRLFILVDGAKSCLGVKTPSGKGSKTAGNQARRLNITPSSHARIETHLKNLARFLDQARYDPSVSLKVLEDWEETTLRYLSNQSEKLRYADLYGKLVTEWLSSERNVSTDGDIDMAESFEELPGVKKLEARVEWEKVVFEPASIDIQELKNYLAELFITQKKGPSNAIRILRENVEDFENELARPNQFNIQNLRSTIQGLSGSDLLSNEKREAIKDFLGNDTILAEIVDVLNMRMATLDRWSWGESVQLEQRRKLNGGYSIHMHEDLLQAIFLHYIGIKWSVFFKSAFKAIRNDNFAWKSNCAVVSPTARKRRFYFLGSDGVYTEGSLSNKRNKTNRGRYFIHQLRDYDNQNIEVQEGEEEAEYANFVSQTAFDPPNSPGYSPTSPQYSPASPPMPMQQMRMSQQMAPQQAAFSAYAPAQSAMQNRQMMMLQQQRAQQQAQQRALKRSRQVSVDDSDDEYSRKPKKPMEAKQYLLHLLSTEIVVNTRFHGELTCFRTVFDSWNPLLPHDSILTMLEFFGVSKQWRAFFKTFLEAPLKFMDDGDSTTPRLRKRGAPGSHTLSDVFGEVILFCLDFSINQSTDGGMLYRLYDDMWFWSKDYEKCAKGWQSVIEFSKVMGVQLNERKTGSVRIGRDAKLTVDDRLPRGQIRWGFLYLNPSNGRFEIDEKMVDSHVDELRKQLEGKSKSVIDWVQAWNTYAATFFSSNFGKSANCFGREHVDKLLATHRRIQERIFEGSNVVQYLKKMISDRFSVTGIPDGFLFFPIELGGLDLKSPFVHLLQIRESVNENPFEPLDEYEEKEREDYAEAKRRFQEGALNRYSSSGLEDLTFTPSDGDSFMSFEEFGRYREEFGGYMQAHLKDTYKKLLERPTEVHIDHSAQMKEALEHLQGQSNLHGIKADWRAMDAYWKWIAQMYGPEMLEKFGGLNVVDPGLLPTGMVSVFRQKRIKWQG